MQDSKTQPDSDVHDEFGQTCNLQIPRQVAVAPTTEV